jgi:beta-N-acetylhexosaminidase
MQLSKLLMMDLSSPKLTEEEKIFLKKYPIGGVCLFGRNIESKEQVAEFTQEIRDIAGEDTIIAIDQEGGSVLRLYDVPYCPSGMSLGAADDTKLTLDVAKAGARGLRAAGINLNFGPIADINNNPLNPIVVDRAFGSEADKVTPHVLSYIEGMQAEGVAATIKHFPGHGDVEDDSHEELPRVTFDIERLHSLELVPFKAAFEKDTAALMTFHGIVECLDKENSATLSRKVITDLLRNELGYDGLVFTDALDMGAIAKFNTPAQAALRAIKAGVDMPLHIGPLSEHASIIEGYQKAFENGELDQGELADKFRRIQTLTKKYPAQADPTSAWTEGDEELLQKASDRGICALNGLSEALSKDDKTLIISPTGYHVSIASMLPSKPVPELTKELIKGGINIESHSYDSADFKIEDIISKSLPYDKVIFVTVNSLRMNVKEKELCKQICNVGKIIHVGLWNPYHAEDLDCPTLLTFNPETRAVKAAAKALLSGNYGSAKLPITLNK